MNPDSYHKINDTLNDRAFQGYLNAQQSRLPKLDAVQQVSPRVIRILGQNAGKFTLQGTNTYIVGTGSERIIIDAGQGIPEWTELILSTFTEASITPSYVLLTHWHPDHVGGVPDLIRLYPHLAGSIFKHIPSKGQEPITDGQTFSVEGATIRAFHSPGHSQDHMCFILEEENAMFTGDNVLGHSTGAVEHLSAWMSSLQTMLSHDCSIGYPGHGDIIPNLGAKIRGELSQKKGREKRVLRTLGQIKCEEKRSGRGKGSVTVKQLVASMHGEVDENMRTMALEPVTDEILRKLAEDERVGFELRRGEKKWFAVEMC